MHTFISMISIICVFCRDKGLVYLNKQIPVSIVTSILEISVLLTLRHLLKLCSLSLSLFIFHSFARCFQIVFASRFHCRVPIATLESRSHQHICISFCWQRLPFALWGGFRISCSHFTFPFQSCICVLRQVQRFALVCIPLHFVFCICVLHYELFSVILCLSQSRSKI